MTDISILKKEGSCCTELFQCFYDLSENECDAFYAVAASEGTTLDDLSALISRDRSTTHRLLQKLVGLDLCYKEKKTLDRGGYIHVYKAYSVKRIKTQLENRISDYVNQLNSLASRIESDLNRKIKNRASELVSEID